ncbi:putative transmembrane protein, partial [Toxoplasma gondii VAND]
MSTARRKEGISLTLLLSRRISSSFVSSRSSLSSSLLLFHLVFFSFSYTVFYKPGAGLSLALRPSPPHPPLSSFFSSSFTSPCPASVASPSSPSSFSSSPLSFSVPLPRLRRPSTASRLWTFPRLSVRNRRHDSLFLRSRRCLQKARRSERRGRDSRTLLLFLSSVGTAECPSGCGRRPRGPASLDRWKAKQYRHSHLSASPCASPLFSSSSFLFRSSSLSSPPLSLDAASSASSPVLFRRRLPSASSLSSVSSLSSSSSLSSFSSSSSFSSFLSPFSLPLAFPSCSSSSSLGLQHRSGVTPHVRPTEETIETVEISDGFLTEEEEQKAHYPFVDAPLNLLVDPTPLRKEMEARQRRRQRLSLLQSLAASPLSPQAQHALHVSRQSESTNTATDAGEETETPGDSETECEAVDPVPPDVRTDLVELDRFCPGLGPWPSTADLQRLNATYDRLPGTLHEDTNSELHYSAEVKTIAEAQLEFERWRPRMGLDRLYWVLDADEEAQLPPHFLKRYKAVRRQLLPAPRQQFAQWLGENYVSPDEPLPEVGIPEEVSADSVRNRGLGVLTACAEAENMKNLQHTIKIGRRRHPAASPGAKAR